MAKEEFIPKLFSAAHRQVIKQANAIIDEYEALGYKLTLRQIHYQFVARDWYENTQANYKRLGNILDAARKAGRIDWDAIEDRTRTLRRIQVWDSPESIMQSVAHSFRLDPWDYQPTRRRVEIWVEKDAAVGIVQPTCDALRLPYFSCRGYSSSSTLYEAGKRLRRYADAGYETLVLYLGDHDPSGVQMTEVADERVSLYARQNIEFRRIALTMAQVEEHNPPPNFAKETDSRTKWYVERFNTDDCWELDALRPQVVDALIRAEVEPLIDWDSWNETMEREESEKATFADIIGNWARTKAAPQMLDYIREVAQREDQPENRPEDSSFGHDDHRIAAQSLWDVTDDAQSLLEQHGFDY